VEREEAVEIRGKVRDGEVTGVEERAGRGAPDADSVEDGTAIVGVDHAPRIGTALSNWLSDARVHIDRVDLDRPTLGGTLVRRSDLSPGDGVQGSPTSDEGRDAEQEPTWQSMLLPPTGR
jgi:hypothetical protein